MRTETEMFRLTTSEARRLSARLLAAARLLGLGGTRDQVLRPGQGRQRD